MNSRRVLICCALVLTSLHGCGRQEIRPWQPQTESERRLADRVTQFYSHGQQHDHEAMYDMFASTLRAHADKREWLSVFAAEEDPGDGVISFTIVSVELSDSAETPMYLKESVPAPEKVASVEMKIVRRRRGKEMSDVVMDTWVWEEEDWRFAGTD